MNITVKYHNRRMLLTVDLDCLFRVLEEAFGQEVSVSLEPMSDTEQKMTTRDDGQILAVLERFWVLEQKGGAYLRRPDLETKIQREGRK